VQVEKCIAAPRTFYRFTSGDGENPRRRSRLRARSGRQRLLRSGVWFLLLFARSAATARRATTTPRQRHTRSNSCAPSADGHTTLAVTIFSPPPLSCRLCTRPVRWTWCCLSRVSARFSASFTRRPPPYRI